jgi:cytochrome P450
MTPEYLEVLVEKATQDRFPSDDLLSRMRHAAQNCES